MAGESPAFGVIAAMNNFKIGDVMVIPHGNKDNVFCFKIEELDNQGYVSKMSLMSNKEVEEYKLTKAKKNDEIIPLMSTFP